MTTSAPQSSYFEKPEIALNDDEVLLFCCLKNEAIRLPYFLDYYRSKGIKTFFIIDNASTDGGGEFLKQQPDVHYFYTEMSYKGSSAGRLWMQELCDHYGMGRWCLTVDVDELLVWPGAEEMSLTDLTIFLDAEGTSGLFTVFLDMYSDKPLAETIYTPGEPFLDVCPFYETDTYILEPGSSPPYLSIFGGPRGKEFINNNDTNNGPMMKKIPLIKWFEGFSYRFSTHSHKYVPLSDVTGALLHFKFFDFFTDLAAYESKRGDRRQPQDYAHYASTMTGEKMFYNQQSLNYRSSANLVRQGVMRSTKGLQNFAAGIALKNGPAAEKTMRALFPEAPKQPKMHKTGKFSLGAISNIWPFVHNPKVIEQFSDGSVNRRTANRSLFVRQATRSITVLDTTPDGLLIEAKEIALYREVNPRLSFAIYVGEDLKGLVPVMPDTGAIQVDETALMPSVYRVGVDWKSFATPGEDALYNLAVYLVPDEMNSDGYLTTTKRKNAHRLLSDPLIDIRMMLLEVGGTPAEGLSRLQMDGVIEKVEGGNLIGWLRDDIREKWNNPISVYINGRFAGNVRPDVPRKTLAPNGLSFKMAMPLEYFYERGETTLSVVARPIGTGASLRRTPLTMEGAGRDFTWDLEKSLWRIKKFDDGSDG